MIKRTCVLTRLLKPGMILDQSIVDRLGRVLIARGAVLDEYMIDSLLKLGVMRVYTREGEEEPEKTQPELPKEIQKKVNALRVSDPVKVQLSESVKKRVAEGIQYIYKDTGSHQFMDTSKSITRDLMKAITENDAIAVDISTLKTSDEYTFKHSVDVATMSMIIAKKHGLSENEIYQIGIAGLLHDLGKSQVPNEILNKPARLTDEEFAIMKQHSVFGYNILKGKKDISSPVALAVLQHHEKINGKGYPLGLTEDQMHPYAKILSVADIYDALVTQRPYKKAFTQRDAVEMIMSMTNELDIDVMKSFLGSVILYPVDSTVELSNGEKARVVKNNPKYVLRPTVVGITSGTVYNLSEDLECANIIII